MLNKNRYDHEKSQQLKEHRNEIKAWKKIYRDLLTSATTRRGFLMADMKRGSGLFTPVHYLSKTNPPPLTHKSATPWSFEKSAACSGLLLLLDVVICMQNESSQLSVNSGATRSGRLAVDVDMEEEEEEEAFHLVVVVFFFYYLLCS